MIQARRLRLDAAGTRLPNVLWFVIFAGAVISLSASLLHGIMVVLHALFIGLVVFMIFALDRPFRGDRGLRPEPYQLVYDQLMRP